MTRPRFTRIAAALVAVAASLAPGPPQKAKPGPPASDPPPLNRKVAAFAREHVGEAVGDGQCIALATEALRASGAKVFPFDDPAGDFVWGRPVEAIADAQPGDILQFRDAVFEGKRTVGRRREYWHLEYPHHTAVVARVTEGGKVVTIWHQNVSTRGQDPASKHKVQETTVRVDSLQPGGKIHVFRPVDPSAKIPVDVKPSPVRRP